MWSRMRARSAFVSLLCLLTIAFAVGSSAAQGLIDFAPVVSAPDTINGTEGELISFGVTAVDYNEEPIASLTAAGSAVDAGAAFLLSTEDHTAGTLNWTPGFDQSGTYSVTFTASNTQTGSKTTVIQIAEAPDLIVESLTHDPASPTTSDNITFTAVVRNQGDGPAGASTLNLKVGGESEGSNHEIPPLAAGTTFTVIRNVDPLIAQGYLATATADAGNDVTESNEDNNVTTDEFTVTPAPTDHRPVVTSPIAVNGEEGGDLSFTVSASDPDSDPIESLDADLSDLPGENATFTANEDNTEGTLNWEMAVGDSGTYNVTFTASANDLSGSSTTQINVFRAGANATGVFTWTPQTGDEGEYDIIFSATDEGGTTNFTTHIIVNPASTTAPRQSPRALAPQAPGATQKGPIISGTGTVSGSPGTPLSASVAASTDNTISSSITLRAPRIVRAGSAAQTTTLSADMSALPAGNNGTFVVDNQPVISGPATQAASPGAPMTLVRGASDPDVEPIDSFTADLSGLPAGNNATFTVDASNSTGTLHWTPTATDAGTYVVNFTAFNQLVGLGSTTITVSSIAAARIFVVDPVKLNIGGNRGTHCIQIEPVSGSFAATNVNLATVRMLSTGTGTVSQIPAITGKPAVIEDRDHNGISELTTCFNTTDLRALFSLLRDKTTQTVQITGQLMSGAYFAGTTTVVVIANGPKVGSASIAPNPLNPQAKLSLNLGRGGWLKVTLYDMQGRLVRELVNEQNAAPGPREILIDGTDSKGSPLASGVYYFRVQSADGTHNGRLAIVR
jgi:CARDB protein/flagellar hook capping protein FlgD/Big-like domain-containing protein